MRTKPSARRVLYLQYTNPAGYPPLEHSSRLLANRGWQVHFVGTGAEGANALRFLPHERITVEQMPFCPGGWQQKLHYMRFCAWALREARRWQPDWVYASDPLASPAALLISTRLDVPVIYHEHDSPDEQAARGIMPLVLRARRVLANNAALCLLPNEQRLAHFVQSTGVSVNDTRCVWNCPRLDEVAAPRSTPPHEPLTLYYHGTLVPERVPESILVAMALLRGRVRLHLVGYETVGSRGFKRAYLQRAHAYGVHDAVQIDPPQPRHQLWQYASRGDIGLALAAGADANLRALTGASNKVFDYLAVGQALLVPDRPDWRALYVGPGYGVACDPTDGHSIARALQRLLDRPEDVRAMGERGRQRILTDWNYDRQFEPVAELLSI